MEQVPQPAGARGGRPADRGGACGVAALDRRQAAADGDTAAPDARGEGFEVGLTTVKEAVAEWKRKRREVFVPLVYPPGDLAEVDFFEVLVELSGTTAKAWMFLMRLMHSGRDFAWIYQRQDQACFLDGHVRAFDHFGGVP